MKNQVIYTVVFLLIISFSITSAHPFTAAKRNANIETNLIKNLDSEIEGLKVSSIQVLGDLKLESSVIPLQQILNNDKNESARIAAALSLYKIGDLRGIFTIKQTIRFDESKRVREICKNIYNQYTKNTLVAAQ
ncbi:MAG: HEAT repeat domain-containing protein [bacterium]